MHLLPLAALLALQAAFAGACSSAADCGLLGECVSSACVCDPGWTGPACASLDLLPAPVDAGLRQSNSSNWCGTLLRDEEDASLFHSYNADFGGCRNGLSIWLTGSRVIHWGCARQRGARAGAAQRAGSGARSAARRAARAL